MPDSITQRAHLLANSFEAEIFVHLLLRNWNHPSAEDAEFRNDLLESATEALRAALAGQTLLEPLRPQDLNFIAAVWYVEWAAVQAAMVAPHEKAARERWLEDVRRALPSCFCPPDDLGP